jgi:hypothetical protein
LAAQINFIKPGKSDVFAEFKIDEKLLQFIKNKTQNGDKTIFDLPVQVWDKEGVLIAEITKTLYVRKKRQ